MEKEIYSDLVTALINLDNAIRNFLRSIMPSEEIVSERTYISPPSITEIQQLQQLQQVVPPLISVIERPFDGHRFFVAPQKITSTGDKIDLGREVDFVMVMPSIDAQIDFDTQITDQTPVVLGGTVYSHPQRTRVIYFKGTSSTLQGTLSVWAYWWK